MIIAVDFDGTLCIDEQPNSPLFLKLIQAKRSGAYLILWTSRAGSSLVDAVNFCKVNGLTFNSINANHPAIIKRMGYDSRKVVADLYIDDKAAPFIRN